MRPSRRVVTILASTIAISILIPFTPATSGACWNYKDKERAFARKINASRRNNDQRNVRLDRHLSRVARAHTNAMVSRGDLFHTNRLGSKVTRWYRLGENVGFGSTVRSLHRAFMSSPGHRSNILGRYKWIGIGSRVARGHLWVTVVFESRRDPGTTLRMPSC